MSHFKIAKCSFLCTTVLWSFMNGGCSPLSLWEFLLLLSALVGNDHQPRECCYVVSPACQGFLLLPKPHSAGSVLRLEFLVQQTSLEMKIISLVELNSVGGARVCMSASLLAGNLELQRKKSKLNIN